MLYQLLYWEQALQILQMPVSVRKHAVPAAATTDRSSALVDVKWSMSGSSTAVSFSVRTDSIFKLNNAKKTMAYALEP